MKDEGLEQGEDGQGGVIQHVDGEELACHRAKAEHKHEPQAEVAQQKEHGQAKAIESPHHGAGEGGPAQADPSGRDHECPH